MAHVIDINLVNHSGKIIESLVESNSLGFLGLASSLEGDLVNVAGGCIIDAPVCNFLQSTRDGALAAVHGSSARRPTVAT